MPSLTEIKHAFGTRDWESGRRLVRFKKVLKDSINRTDALVTGRVKSERSSSIYSVEIDIDEFGLESTCTCPVGYQCKHGAALAIQAFSDHGSAHQGPSDKVLESWLTKIQQTDNKPKLKKTELVYILSPNPNNGLGINISVKTSRILKSGALSKVLQNEYLSEYFLKSPNLSEEDKQLCASILSTVAVGIDRYRDLGLIQRLVNTQRCFWEGVTETPLVFGEACEGWFTWQGEGTFQLTPNMADQTATLLLTDPPSYLDKLQNRIGEVNFTMQADSVQKLLTMPSISEQQLAWVLPQLKAVLQDDFEQLGSPVKNANIDIYTPKPKLVLSSPDYDKENPTVKLSFGYAEIDVNPRDTSHLISAKQQPLGRNLPFEQQAIERLHQAGFKTVSDYYRSETYGPAAYYLRVNQSLWPFLLHKFLPELSEQGWQIVQEDDFYYSMVEAGQFEAEVSEEGSDFFSLEMNVDIDGQRLPLFPILQSAIKQLPKKVLVEEQVESEASIYIELGKGQILLLAVEKIKPLLNQFVELFMPNALKADGSLTISKLHSPSVLDALDTQSIVSKGAQSLRKIAQKLNNFEGITPVECPTTVNAELREYQQEGLNWLQFLREYQLAGILADDMGLGKTLQTLANLAIEHKNGRLTKPALIIAPTSVIYNWQSEIAKFVPTLRCLVIHGDKRKPKLAEMMQYEIVVTSYPLIVKDLAVYQEQQFHYLVLDEAHYIKNPKTKLYAAVVSLQATHKLCVTGTPMENNLGELWSQFNFLLPSFLSSQGQFTKLFRTPIEKQQSMERKALLNQRIKPFILRRTKDRIAKDLPEKNEIIRTIRLESKQAELYESVRLAMDQRLREIIKSKGLMRAQIEILDAMLKLRQVCCHPQLLTLPGAKKVTQSAKLDCLMGMLPELVEEGRRILLFSQFTSMLALIEIELQKQEIEYVKLTGSTKDRQTVINQFKQGKVPVFLISLKAGGTGLNLTEADTVIHFDPWWNPAVENQATDRVHRIGQHKPVFVYKLIVEGSIEQKIQELQNHKQELAESILSDKLVNKDTGLTSEVLQSLLKPLTV